MRGVGILLVVLGHSLSSLRGRPGAGWVEHVIGFIFSFHMPLFFFVSGYLGARFFVPRRTMFRHTVVRQVKRLGLVYFFYTVLIVAIKLPANAFVERPIRLSELPAQVLLFPADTPSLVLWFIYTLFLMQMLVLSWHTLLPVDYGRRSRQVAVLAVVLAINLASPTLPQALGLHFLGRHLLYFYLGFLSASYWRAISGILMQRGAWIAAAPLAYSALMMTAPPSLVALAPVGFVWASLGIVMTWAACLWVDRFATSAAEQLDWVSDHSYAIYLNHGWIHMGFVIATYRLLSIDPYLVFPLDLAISVCFPVLLAKYIYGRNMWLRRLALGDWRR
jgi:fucose 4-O-acetylase-like acetyltransferase